MGVNRVGFGIYDDDAVQFAAQQEIIRRYFKTGCEYKKGYVDIETYQRAQLIMEELELKPEDRAVVVPARNKAIEVKQSNKKGNCFNYCYRTWRWNNNTGKSSDIMDAAAAMIINAIKHLANIADEIHFISTSYIRTNS